MPEGDAGASRMQARPWGGGSSSKATSPFEEAALAECGLGFQGRRLSSVSVLGATAYSFWGL